MKISSKLSTANRITTVTRRTDLRTQLDPRKDSLAASGRADTLGARAGSVDRRAAALSTLATSGARGSSGSAAASGKAPPVVTPSNVFGQNVPVDSFDADLDATPPRAPVGGRSIDVFNGEDDLIGDGSPGRTTAGAATSDGWTPAIHAAEILGALLFESTPVGWAITAGAIAHAGYEAYKEISEQPAPTTPEVKEAQKKAADDKAKADKAAADAEQEAKVKAEVEARVKAALDKAKADADAKAKADADAKAKQQAGSGDVAVPKGLDMGGGGVDRPHSPTRAEFNAQAGSHRKDPRAERPTGEAQQGGAATPPSTDGLKLYTGQVHGDGRELRINPTGPRNLAQTSHPAPDAAPRTTGGAIPGPRLPK